MAWSAIVKIRHLDSSTCDRPFLQTDLSCSPSRPRSQLLVFQSAFGAPFDNNPARWIMP